MPKNPHSASALRPPASGFTLIELFVVVVIISILAAFVAPAILSKLGPEAEAKAVEAD